MDGKGIAVRTNVLFPMVADVTNISYTAGTLEVQLKCRGQSVSVTFPSIVGFRVLDEGDLLEFWPSFSSNNGWLFQIEEGGWLELESSRAGFISQGRSNLQEYLVTGVDMCVSVLALLPPEVRGEP